MTLEELELVAKQQLQIEKYKELLQENKEILNQLHGKFFAIGQPLNDNILQFNERQIKWCMGVYQLIELINKADE